MTCNKLQLSVFCVFYQRSSLVICLCFLFLNTFSLLRLDVLNTEEEFCKYLVHVVIYCRKNLDFAEVANRSFSHCYRPSHEIKVNRNITHQFTSWPVTNVLSYLCLVLNKVKNVRKPYMSILQHYIVATLHLIIVSGLSLTKL